MKRWITDMIKGVNPSLAQVTWVGLVLVLCAALLQYYLNGDHVNRDGVLYLFQAHAINAGDSNAARDLYPNVIFAQLIAFLQSSMNLTYATAAHGVGLIFFMASSFFFFKTLKLISSDPVLMICGVIMLLTSLALDKYLVMILRDHALWAGLMSMTYYFIRWSQEQGIFYLILSLGSAGLAGLFRSEALSLTPVLLLFAAWVMYHARQDLSIPKSLIVKGLLITLIGLGLFSMGGTHFSYARVGELVHLAIGAITNLTQPLPIQTNNYWLAELLKDYPLLMKASFFTTLILFKWMTAVGLIGLFLLVLGLKAKTINIQLNTRLFLFAMLAMTLAWPILNLFSTNVITNRYLVPHLWLLMIFMTIGFHQLWVSTQGGQNKLFTLVQALVALLLLIRFIDVMIDSHQPSIDQEVGRWSIENNINLDQTYAANLRVRYYMDNLTIPTQTLADALNDSSIRWFIVGQSINNHAAQSLTMIKSFPEDKSAKLYIYEREHAD